MKVKRDSKKVAEGKMAAYHEGFARCMGTREYRYNKIIADLVRGLFAAIENEKED